MKKLLSPARHPFTATSRYVPRKNLFTQPYQSSEEKSSQATLIHHQSIICCVASVRSFLRRIGPYASVVAPWRLASDALLVIRNVPKPVDSYEAP